MNIELIELFNNPYFNDLSNETINAYKARINTLAQLATGSNFNNIDFLKCPIALSVKLGHFGNRAVKQYLYTAIQVLKSLNDLRFNTIISDYYRLIERF